MGELRTEWQNEPSQTSPASRASRRLRSRKSLTRPAPPSGTDDLIDDDDVRRAFGAKATVPAQEPGQAARQPRPQRGATAGRRRRVVIDSQAGRRPGQRRDRGAPRPEVKREPEVPTGPVKVESGVTVKDLAEKLGISPAKIIAYMMSEGQMVTLTVSLIRRRRAADRPRVRARDHDRAHRRRGGRGGRLRRSGGLAPAAAAGGHDHGPRRPRQDHAARRDPRVVGGRDRGRRHHAAHRRLPGRCRRRPQGHLPRHPGPRGLHGDARPRRQGHRRGRARGRRRRRRDAPDGGGDRPRQGGRRCRSWSPSTRSTRPDANPERVRGELVEPRACSRRSGAATRSSSTSRPRPRRTSTSCSRCCCCRQTCSS